MTIHRSPAACCAACTVPRWHIRWPASCSSTARTSQRPFMAPAQLRRIRLFSRRRTGFAAHSEEPLSAQALAAALGVSYRTLHRRFDAAAGMAPLAYLQALRVEQAKELLEGTSLSLERVVERVGYSDVPAFRRLFLRSVG